MQSPIPIACPKADHMRPATTCSTFTVRPMPSFLSPLTHHRAGVSLSGPLPPPVAFRETARPNAARNERTTVVEAACAACKRWVPIQGVRMVEPKNASNLLFIFHTFLFFRSPQIPPLTPTLQVKEIFWWKHAAQCPGPRTPARVEDVFEPDAVYARLAVLQAEADAVCELEVQGAGAGEDGEDEAERAG
ncbi:hypothetical protein H0H81_010763 [Sphagnurus paluster]|uniref:Transcription regulator Rua1 C-terminal domain-containing protein n=1 Tax=Sphagnurus paluster TaxID=117069 RepID=A0A9P7KHR6_9AGAR|nr:hypothetical protein H0H81_010763 [Sphagnurus paluster]